MPRTKETKKPLRKGSRKRSDVAISRPCSPPLKDGLPWQGFAIAPDKDNSETWQLPHHTVGVQRAASGAACERTVDWLLLEKAVLLLSRFGDEGRRVTADPELVIQAARHLAGHYRKAGRQVPDALCVLI